VFQQKDYEDKLREITSIGSGHLATRLSKMVNWKVEISLPVVWAEKSKRAEEIIPFRRRVKLLFRKAIAVRNEFTVRREAAGIQMPSEKMGGLIVQIMETKTAKSLVRLLFNREVKELDEIDKVALKKTFTDLATDMTKAVSELIGEAISVEPAKMVETPLLSGIKETLKEQREALGWTYFSTVNIYIRGKEGISFLVLLLPFFDIARILPPP
jgi:chemotaxis protein CheY-P-specific phosphatase CheC